MRNRHRGSAGRGGDSRRHRPFGRDQASMRLSVPAVVEIDCIASRQAFSQRRHDSAQIRQCSCLLAWRSHSSAHTRQA